MKRVRCHFCHEYVEKSVYAAHKAEHLKLRPDGQLSEYMTLPPEQRIEGDLEGVPVDYKHLRCGAVTGMPEEIVRSYLRNPFLYSADRTFCTGCSLHVPNRECVWLDTGENLRVYMDKLRAGKPEFRPDIFTRIRIAIANFFG